VDEVKAVFDQWGPLVSDPSVSRRRHAGCGGVAAGEAAKGAHDGEVLQVADGELLVGAEVVRRLVTEHRWL
jgi:hypothetical protein